MTDLVDTFTRHQIYLEGFKAGSALTVRPFLRQLDDGIRQLFATLHVDTLDELKKSELRAFIRRVQDLFERIIRRYVTAVVRFLRRFMDAERGMLKAMLAGTSPEPGAAPAYGPLASQVNAHGRDALWAHVLSSPMPGNGQMLLTMLNAFASASRRRAADLIQKAAANGVTINAALGSFVGERSALFGNGALRVMERQNTSLLNTAIQHVSQMTVVAASSPLFGEYTWSSVIDSGTTAICVERHGHTFTYNDGPIPPAHYGCRAEIIPGANNSLPASLSAWLSTQPTTIVDDMFRNSDINNPRPLSLDAYTSKLPTILS